MSITKITAKGKDVGGIPVARLLPQAKRRTIGAWCFLDHAGPAQFSPESKGMQVGSHPHTNLQTFTWMLDGEVWHQDSLGYRQLIRPKQVNLMTAGTGRTQGIAHTEQTPADCKRLHAVQLWIALPMNQAIAANFQHYPELPEWQDGDVHYVLTTGSFAGRTAPTQQFSPLLGLDVRVTSEQTLVFPAEHGWEYGVLVLAGEITTQNGERYQADELAIISDCDGHETFTIQAQAGTHMMLLGGEPLPHSTLIWWNFVADSREALCEAVDDWNNGHPRFGAEIDLTGTGLQRLHAPQVPDKLK